MRDTLLGMRLPLGGPSSFMSLAMLALLACGQRSCVSDERSLVCVKSDCDGDRAQLWGPVPKLAADDLDFSIQICSDDDCYAQLGHAAARSSFGGDQFALTGGCKFSPNQCTDDTHWLLGISLGVGLEPDAGLAKSFSVKLVDTSDGSVLLDEHLKAEYETVTPQRCDRNPLNVTCTHFDASWGLH